MSIGISRAIAAKTFARRVITGSPSVSWAILVSMRARAIEAVGSMSRKRSLIRSILAVGFMVNSFSWSARFSLICSIVVPPSGGEPR